MHELANGNAPISSSWNGQFSLVVGNVINYFK
jgi:hypothetical protein